MAYDFDFLQIQDDLYKHFDFGASAGPVEGDFIAHTDISFDVSGKTGPHGLMSGSIGMPVAEMQGEWDADVWWGHTKKVCGLQSLANRKHVKIDSDWQQDSRRDYLKKIVGQDGDHKYVKKCFVTQELFEAHKHFCSLSEQGTQRFKETTGNSDTATRRRYSDAFSFDRATPASPSVLYFPYVSCWPRRQFRCGSFEKTKHFVEWWNSSFNLAATGSYTRFCNQFTKTMHPEFIWPIPEEPIPEIPDTNFYGDPNLDLQCLLPNPLWSPVAFNLGAVNVCYRAVNPDLLLENAKVIIVTYDLWIKVVSTQNLIACDSISLSIDRDSWGWAWSAQMHHEQPDLVTNQEVVEININGHRWTGIVESYRGSGAYNQKTYTIGGRSELAELTTPYTVPRSRNETNSRTLKQLAGDEVYLTGWTLNWNGITDWTVPGNVFSYVDKTPLDALTTIIQSAGAVLRAANNTKDIMIQPRYKVTPWDIDSYTPDAQIALSVILSTGISWRPKSLRNGVWVSGTNQGVRVRVYRTGTDGSPYNAMVVDALITDAQGAIQKGKEVLSLTGKRRDVELQMPLVEEIGILSPGDVVEVLDSPSWKGYVDSIRIQAAFGAGIHQTVTVEHVQEV